MHQFDYTNENMDKLIAEITKCWRDLEITAVLVKYTRGRVAEVLLNHIIEIHPDFDVTGCREIAEQMADELFINFAAITEKYKTHKSVYEILNT